MTTSKSNLCAACGQPLPAQSRGGVYLSPRQARIFDLIDRWPGITIDAVAARIGNASINLIRQHIHQINARLVATDIQISGNGRGERGYYRIVRSSTSERDAHYEHRDIARAAQRTS